MNSTDALEPPYTPNRDPCVGHPANEFTHMGLSVRTHDYRYTEWRLWDGHICEPDWEKPPSGVELCESHSEPFLSCPPFASPRNLLAADSHVGDITPACFDCFENENIAAAADNKEIVTAHAALLKEQFQRTTQHTGCPHPFGPDSSDEDLAAIRQSYAEGGERVPDQFL